MDKIEKEIEKTIKEYYDNFTDEVQHVYDNKAYRVINEVTFTVEGMSEFIKQEMRRIARLTYEEGIKSIKDIAWCSDCFDSMEALEIKDKIGYIKGFKYYCSGCNKTYKLKEVSK